MIHRAFRIRHDPRLEAIWLTVYADLITNLALVFLALFGLTVMGGDAIATAVRSMKLMQFMPDANLPLIDVLAPVLQKRLDGVPGVSVTDDVGAVRIEFGETALFDSGRAQLKAGAIDPLLRVADLLRGLPHTVVVEGHTDSIPLDPGAPFRDNWALSLARSMAVVRVLVDKGHLPPSQVAAAAYGDNRPKASNATSDGRRRNRRVEIDLFKSFRYESSHAEAKP